MLCRMSDSWPSPDAAAPHVRADLGRVLVTGGSGFVGANLVTELLDRGHQVRSFDRAPSPLPAHPLLELIQGDICDPDTVAAAVDGIDTVFHTAAIIDLMGGAPRSPRSTGSVASRSTSGAPRTSCTPRGPQESSGSSTPRPTAW